MKRRVSELEGAFGSLTHQVKGVHRDLLVFQAKTEQRFDRMEQRPDKMKHRLDGRIDLIDRGLRGLRKDMPKIVGDAVRDAVNGKRRSKK